MQAENWGDRAQRGGADYLFAEAHQDLAIGAVGADPNRRAEGTFFGRFLRPHQKRNEGGGRW